MASLKGNVLQLIEEKDAEAFAEWAFGPDYEIINRAEDFAKAWNNLHKEKYEIDLSNDIFSDLMIMTKIWKSENRKKNGREISDREPN
jgi:hypothetical protein